MEVTGNKVTFRLVIHLTNIAFATMPIHKAFVDEKAYLSLDGNKIAKKSILRVLTLANRPQKIRNFSSGNNLKNIWWYG